MISVHILYPKTDDTNFNMEYYTSSHMPMVANALGDACVAWGATTVTTGPYEAIGWCHVKSEDDWNAALAEHGGDILGDIPNYTNSTPDLVVGNIAQ